MARTGRPRNGLPHVLTVAVGGVTVGSHMLTRQGERLTSLTNRVLRRLDHDLRANPEGLPSPAWLEAFRYVAPTILALFREQRDRAALASVPQAPLTEEEYENGMRELRSEALQELSIDELEQQLLKRRTEAS